MHALIVNVGRNVHPCWVRAVVDVSIFFLSSFVVAS